MKPKSVEIYPVYICNDCGSRHCETIDYVKKIGKILCGCGTVLDLTPIETFKVSPVFKSLAKITKKQSGFIPQPPEPPEPTQEPETSMFAFLGEGDTETDTQEAIDKESFNESVDLLVSLGWKKREATAKVKSASEEWTKKENKNINKENFLEFAQFLMFQK